MRRLYEFTWKLSGLAGADAVADGAAGEIQDSLRRPTIILLDQKGVLSLTAAWPPEDSLDRISLDAARLAFTSSEPTGLGTDTLGDSSWHFIPLRTPRRSIGVVGVARGKTGIALDSEARALLATLAEQTAAVLDRAFLAGEIDREVMVSRGSQATRNYAKRQYTWFAHQPPADWPRFTKALDGATMAEALALLEPRT